MVSSKKQSKANVIIISILAVLAVGGAVATGCLAWSLATANERIEYLEKRVEELKGGVVYDDPTDPEDPDDPNLWVAKKPLIYLYPTEDTQVSVKLGNPSKLTSTYPAYDGGWNVLAKKDGTLVKDERSYYGLYWEGANYAAKQSDEGFVVAGKDSAKFLEEKLALLGLTEREANEMIIYWLPQLEKNAYNYIRFDLNDVMDRYMPLNVSPKPDTTIRIMMVFKPLEKSVAVREQKLSTPERKGFTVIEWGGSEIK